MGRIKDQSGLRSGLEQKILELAPLRYGVEQPHVTLRSRRLCSTL